MRYLGMIFLCVLAGWIVFTFVTGDLSKPSLQIPGIGSGFEGNLALPKERIDASLDKARSRVVSVADTGYAFRIGSRVAAWLAFLATASITLVAGWYGQAPVPSPGGGAPGPNTTGLPRPATRAVTLLAALAAVLTAGGGLATQEAETLATWARERHRDVVEARAKVIGASTAVDAQTILDDLDLKLRQ
jgi:hypothetical protein